MKIYTDIDNFCNDLYDYADNNPNRIDYIQLLGLQDDGVSVLLSNLFGQDIELSNSELFIAFDDNYMAVLALGICNFLENNTSRQWSKIIQKALTDFKDDIANWQDWSFYDDYLDR